MLICLCPFGIPASKTLNYLVFQSFDFEVTWWRLLQKHVVRNKLDIYVFIILIKSKPIIICENNDQNCEWLYLFYYFRSNCHFALIEFPFRIKTLFFSTLIIYIYKAQREHTNPPTGLTLGLIVLQKAELSDWHFDIYKLASEEIACIIICPCLYEVGGRHWRIFYLDLFSLYNKTKNIVIEKNGCCYRYL